jgi:hypothetical protein
MMEIEFSSPVGHEKRSMHPETHEPLKLVALDEDDLKILSANLQDAVLRMSDMAWVPSEHRFAAILNRFDWLAAVEGEGSHLRRCRCALRFDRVKRAQVQNIKPGEPSAFAELLAVTYEQAQPPSGYITLYFAGGGAVRLEVECIEGELCDLGVAWKTVIKPQHAIADVEVVPAPAEAAQDTN